MKEVRSQVSRGGVRFKRGVWGFLLGLAVLGLVPALAGEAKEFRPATFSEPEAATKARVLSALGRLPLAFVENQGQVDAQVRYYVKSGRQTLWLTDEGIVFDLLRVKGGAAQMKPDPTPDPRHPKRRPRERQEVERERQVFAQDFVGANKNPTLKARTPLPGIYNYFLGNDPAKWRTGVRAYTEIVYREVWEGIDLKLYGNGRDLEQEFTVKPGGDLSRIRVAYRGIEGLRVARDGSLLIKTAFGELKESKPRIYQEIDGKRVEVAGRFKLLSETAYTFEVGPHHRKYALVIDPTLVYSTFLGESSTDASFGIALDSSGNAYVTGLTLSTNFPTTPGAFDTSYNGGGDVFVTKLDSTGSGPIYSTFLGGRGEDWGFDIAVDSSGDAYVTGRTFSTDFPTTPGAFDTSHNGDADAFVTKLDSTGSGPIYSTFLGGRGEDWGRGIALDASGHAYVTGWTPSTDFPTTPGAFDTSHNGDADAFVTKLDSTGSGLVYSTFLGGSGFEEGHAIALDASGHAYVTGWTWSPDFPTTPGAFDTSHNGGNDAFVTKLDSTGSGPIYSTFLGGRWDDWGHGIALDASGDAYVTGGTPSTDFPTTLGAFQPYLAGDLDAFVAKLALGTVVSLSVSAILPNTGGNTGSVSVLIYGGGLVNGATVKLVRAGEPDIVGDPVSVAEDGRTITTTFDLTGKARGAWDVLVTNPDGSSATLPEGFTIEEARAPQVWVDIVGRDTIRVGREQTFTILYGNRGNIDAVGVLLWIAGIPLDAEVKLVSEVITLRLPARLEPAQSSIFFETSEFGKVIPLVIPIILPGLTGNVTIRLTVPTEREIQLQAFLATI